MLFNSDTNVKIKRSVRLLLLLSTFFGYLEWSGDHQAFIFQMEYEILLKVLSHPKTILHPLIFLPLAGQVLLFISILKKYPSNGLIYLAIIFLGVLFCLVLLSGILTFNWKTLSSVCPFFILSIYCISQNFSKRE